MAYEHNGVLATLESERLRLRAMEYRDAPALFQIFSDAAVMRYWSRGPWTEEAEGVALIDRVAASVRDGTLFQWGVALKESDSVIGTCTLAHLDWRNRRGEIGFALRRDCWGQGYMQEAARTVLTHAFTTLDFHRVEADVDPRNAASIKLLERLGFQKEGYLRERWLVGEEVNDTVFLGLLRREWEGGEKRQTAAV